jgi:hypothetical protein
MNFRTFHSGELFKRPCYPFWNVFRYPFLLSIFKISYFIENIFALFQSEFNQFINKISEHIFQHAISIGSVIEKENMRHSFLRELKHVG